MKITIPEKLSEVRLGKFQQYLIDLKTTKNINHLKIKTFTGLDVDLIPLTEDEIKEIVFIIDKTLTSETVFYPKYKNFSFIKDFNLMTVGEYVDLENNKLNPQNYHKMMAVLFRETTEYYGTKKTAEAMKLLPMNYVNGAMHLYSEWSDGIKETYPEMYGGGTSEGSAAVDYFKKWGWYATLQDAVNGNYFEFKKLLKENVHEFHLHFAHKIDKQKLESLLRQGANTIEL